MKRCMKGIFYFFSFFFFLFYIIQFRENFIPYENDGLTNCSRNNGDMSCEKRRYEIDEYY